MKEFTNNEKGRWVIMSRRALLAGTNGGIIGAIMGIVGVIWSLLSISFATDISGFHTLDSSLQQI